MAEFSVWAEGYATTGGYGRATLLGTAKGKTFKDACVNLAKRDKEFERYFDKNRMTYWGCRLFPTHEEAIKSFG